MYFDSYVWKATFGVVARLLLAESTIIMETIEYSITETNQSTNQSILDSLLGWLAWLALAWPCWALHWLGLGWLINWPLWDPLLAQWGPLLAVSRLFNVVHC